MFCGVGSLDFRLALTLAVASALAYKTATITDAKTDTQVLICEDSDFDVIAFRGTTNLRDWITDADFRFENLTPSVKVHAGFLAAFRSVRMQLWEHLIRSGSKPIHITGHSLGGSLAVLFADFLAQNPESRKRILSVQTFGGARDGNQAFANCYNRFLSDRTFRFVYQEDIVPRLPWCLGRYQHVGQEIFLPSFAIDTPILNPPVWRKMESDAWGLFNAWRAKGNPLFLADMLRDHDLDANYIPALQRLAQPLELIRS